MMVEALVDIQQWVECFQVNNTQVIPACDTLFKCGYTVVDKPPRSQIKRIYTIDRINQETGREDAAAAIDWCSRVNYRMVEFSELDTYISRALAGLMDEGLWAWCGFGFETLAGIFSIPTCWASKYGTYPPPTDAGLDKAPPLPMGFHYAQESTNEPNGIRAQSGMWALQGGQIYIGPWIQSTETVVIEWDGIKRSWADIDLVENDPNLKRAVEWYVRWQHALKYDRDYDAASAASQEYHTVIATMMRECREETAVREASEAMNSGARGASLVVDTFTNEPQSATAQCPNNTTGNPVTVTIPAGTVVSTVSVADANAQAKSLALQQAALQVNCTPIPVTYWNTAQSATASCVGGLGNPTSATVQAGQVSSTVSQAAADATALAQAQAAAQAELSCAFTNTEQTYTAQCPAGHAGANVTKTVPAGTFTSTLSQADADALALASATTQAQAALSCAGSPTVYTNTAQSVTVHKTCVTVHGAIVLSTAINVAAGTFSSQVSQADANGKAISYANNNGNAALQAQCAGLGGH